MESSINEQESCRERIFMPLFANFTASLRLLKDLKRESLLAFSVLRASSLETNTKSSGSAKNYEIALELFCKIVFA